MDMNALIHHGTLPRIVSGTATSSSSTISTSSTPMKLSTVTSGNQATSMSIDFQTISNGKEHIKKEEESSQLSHHGSDFSSSSSNLSSSSSVPPFVSPQTVLSSGRSTTKDFSNGSAARAGLAPLRFIIPSSHLSKHMLENHSVISSLRGLTPLILKSERIIKPMKKTEEIEPEPMPEVEEAQEDSENNQEEDDTVQDVSTSTQESRAAAGKKRPRKSSSSENLSKLTKKSRGVKLTNRSTKSKARPGLRKGKWTHEESVYAAKLTYYFKEGLLPLERGTMLRLYLSQKLNCEPMRITKKFTGGECIGKQVFRPRSHSSDTRMLIEEAQVELVALEASFLKKLKENREECPPMSPELQKVVETDPELDSKLKRGISNIYNVKSKVFSPDTTSEDDTVDEDGEEELKYSSRKRTLMEKDEVMDDASAVGLLLDFFYKANRSESKENDRHAINRKKKDMDHASNNPDLSSKSVLKSIENVTASKQHPSQVDSSYTLCA